MNKNNLKNAIQDIRIKKMASSNKESFPSLPQMAKNLGNDVIKTVKSVASGNPLTSNSLEANNRKEICKSCQFFNSAQDRCTKCGCNMAVKVYLKASNCPIGKW
jgi:uncharacterized paraquat-inducible protein A